MECDSTRFLETFCVLEPKFILMFMLEFCYDINGFT
jgi:hypothetical protein